ncbi:acetylornithine aminotransferase [Candidatus Planktophila sulfonica]|uniref:Acetylornithine aminotransferase n=1 Tax=Candidatus Planktophila sulfonica TaxID=1884904 RepID=A0A249KGK9_9ACTN|nr:acetylornithine transaminase [Candidatus Planktophila sulfonica]ASY15907.1 acetylornithine aminotransferase [Candidatus Planktophila sulfonica]
MKRWQKALQDNYGTPTIELVSGKGSVVKDANGNTYLDFLAGIATNVLGHAHPAIVKSVTKQISTLGHVSNFYAHPNVLELAEKLQKLTGDKGARVFFCNSGAEANEAALKLSRKTGKYKVVATQEAFHGRTMGALSLTGQPSKRNPFKPLIKGIKHVPFGDSAVMKRVITKKTAMVIVEPIMGEAGVIVPPSDYLKNLRQYCDDNGALLVFDCVQTGMGRTGDWFGYEYSGIKPDVITLAKGLGGGLPLGAMIALGSASKLFVAGDHGSTFGGNPVATAAALSVISAIEKEKILSHVDEVGEYLLTELALIPGVTEVRGAGLLIGLTLNAPVAKALTKKCQDLGALINAPGDSTIRIAPALNVSMKQAQKFVVIFSQAMKEVSHV